MSDVTGAGAYCALVLCLGAGGSGCAPSVNSFTASAGSDVNVVDVAASISESAASNLQTPTLGARRAGAASFISVGALTPGSGTSYTRPNLALPAGQHELQLTVPYRAVFQSATQTLTRTIPVTITEPQGCFFFDGVGVAGWAVDGFFEVDDRPTPDARVNVCPGQTPLLVVAVNENYPQNYQSALGQFGSLGLPLRQPCYQDSPPPAVPGGQFIAVDLVSPALAGQAGWAAANGFEVQVSSSFLPLSPDAVVPQVQLAYEKSNGEFEFELNAQGDPVFHPTTGAWQAHSVAEPATDVARVRIRAFVPHDIQIIPDSFPHVRVDRVCPVTAQ